MPKENLDPNADPNANPGNLDPDPNEGKTWRDDINEDIRDSADLTKFDTIEALAQGYINASQLIGRDKIPMPNSESEWEETYNRLGRPTDINGYDLKTLENMPEGLKGPLEEAIPWFRKTAHEVGLNKGQAGKFFSKYTDLITEQVREQTEKVNQEMAETKIKLDTQYGDALPAKMVLANRAMDRFGGEELINLFTKTGLGRDPRIIKAFIGIGELIAEDVGLDIHGEPIESEGDLDAKILDLQSRPAYLNATDPAHASLVKQVETLMKRKHPLPV